MPPGSGAVVRRESWTVPRIFREVQQAGAVSDAEMDRVFNMGIGMVVVVTADAAAEAVAILTESAGPAVVIGEVVAGERNVTLT
jgi:phosphoribosylformylglycinamidine cyclo-ligase